MQITKSRFMAVMRMLVAPIVLAFASQALAQSFVHPGGLHTLADLNRMKTNVLAGNHPWIDDWNVLITDSEAQTNYGTHVTANMGSSRQNADLDAHAAYLNFIRWYVSGDANYANKATNILNKWAAAVNVVPSGTDIPGLIGIPIAHFAEDGELLRTYSGWKTADFQTYTNMMLTYLYPSCNSFLTNHNGACSSHYFANWDACNIEALIAMGVLCDNTNIYNQGVNYFISGAGNGSISNAVPYLYSNGLGQEQESGRDQEHAQLGVGELAAACQTAWNQGLDLYGFANNRLLAGAEYVAQYNLGHDVPYTPLNDCSGDNMFFISNNGRGRLDDRPIWELIYNHYVVLQGLSAPNTTAMARLYRLEQGSIDHFGYGTLTFTLNATNSPYPPAPLPAAPLGLTAQGGVSQVTLNWMPAAGDLVQGYNVLRSTTTGGPYTTIATWIANASPNYTDTSVTNGTTYYYVVSANNQIGTSDNSVEVNVTPVTTTLPVIWTSQDIGVMTSNGSAVYASAGDNTFVVTGYGTGIGGTGDGGFNYTYFNATNDFTIVARLTANNADQMGLMMRASLATNAYLVQFFMADNARQSIVGIRSSSTGGNLNHYDYGDQFTAPPSWYKLTRSGNTFNAYQSADGVSWILADSASVTMPTNYYAGLVINSGSATFDNVAYTNAAVTGTFAPPAAPSNLFATTVSSNQVYLTWSAVTNAVGYNVKRSTVSGGPYTNLITDMPAIGFYDTTTTAGTTYYYVVSAINGGGESTNSTELVPSVPAAPTGLTAAVGTNQISLNWMASVGASSYNVKRATNSSGPFTSNIATVVAANYTDTNVTVGTIYYYVVTAVNSSGESAYSDEASAIIYEPRFIWSGANNSNWNLTTANNWKSNGVSALYQDGSDVIFDDTATGSTNVNIATIVMPASMEFSNSTKTYTLTGASINGTALLTKSGSGTLTLGSANNYTGGTELLNGTLRAANGNAFGTGLITLAGGTWSFTNNLTITNVIYVPTNTTTAISESFAGVSMILSGNIAGGGNLNTSSSANYGGVQLSGDNSGYFGTFTVNNNTSQRFRFLTATAGSSNALWVLNNNTSDGQGANFGNGTLYFGALSGGGQFRQDIASSTSTLEIGALNMDTTFSGIIYQASTGDIFAVNKVGTGTLTFTGANNYSGLTAVKAGRLLINQNHTGAGGFTVSSSATLCITNAVPSNMADLGALTLNSGTTLEFQNVSNLTSALADTTSLTVSGAAQVLITGTNYLVIGNTYPLLTNSGTMAGFANLALQMPFGYGGTLVSNANQILLAVTLLPPVPAAPTNLIATAGDTQVTLNWSASAGATGYNVQQSTTNGGTYTVIGANVTSLSFTNTGLIDGMNYYYVVSALNLGGESTNSLQVSAIPVSLVPPRLVFQASGSQIQLAWPMDHLGWHLESQTNSLNSGLGTNWITVSGSAGTNQLTVPIGVTYGSVFYRLIYP